MKTFEQLKQQAVAIRDAVNKNENSAERVGAHLLDTVEKMESLEITDVAEAVLEAEAAAAEAKKQADIASQSGEIAQKAKEQGDIAEQKGNEADAAAQRANEAADQVTNKVLFKIPQDLSEEEQAQVKRNIGLQNAIAGLITLPITDFSAKVNATTATKTVDNIIPSGISFLIVDIGVVEGDSSTPTSPELSAVLCPVSGGGRIVFQGTTSTKFENFKISVISGSAEKDGMGVEVSTPRSITYKVFQVRYLTEQGSGTFKGSFNSLQILQSAYPTAKPGDYAYVGNPRHLYEWDSSAWQDRGLYITDVDQALDLDSGKAIANKAVAVKLSELEGNILGELNKLGIYRETIGKQPISKHSDVNGNISTSTNLISVTVSNWNAVLYAVQQGEKINIKVNQTKTYVNTNFALIAFVKEFTKGDTAVVIEALSTEIKNHDITYSVPEDGYIYILPNIADVVYAEIEGIYKITEGEYIDFKSLIDDLSSNTGDLSNLDEKVKSNNLVEAINKAAKEGGGSTSIDLYKKIVENPIEIHSSGQYRSLKDYNVIDFVGDNILANIYLIEKGKTYKIYSTLAGGASPTFALAYTIEGTDITKSMPCTILEFCEKNSHEIEFTAEYDGLLFIQAKISDIIITSEVKRFDLGDYIDFNTLIESQQKEIDKINSELTPPTIHIPDVIYAVVGDTLQLFYTGIISCLDLHNYDVRFVSKIGKSYPRYFEYIPTQAEENTVNIEIRDIKRALIAQKEFTIKSVAVPPSPAEEIVIAPFGNSLSAEGKWQKELNRRLTSSEPAKDLFPKGDKLTNLSFIGTMENEGTNYFGIGGWAWVNYATEGSRGWRFQVTGVTSIAVGATYKIGNETYTVVEVNVTEGNGNILTRATGNSTPPESGTLTRTSPVGDETIQYTSVSADAANPLWIDGKVSFVDYVKKCGKSKVDIIVFFLGWNILSAGDLSEGSPNEVYIKTLIDTAHTEYPNATFVLMGVQLPSLNGGLAANYPGTSTLADLRGTIKDVHNYNLFLQRIAGEYEFVDYVDIASQFDSENNMPEMQKNVNTRNSKKEYIGLNGIHPLDSGYYQVSDAMYRYLCYHISNL